MTTLDLTTLIHATLGRWPEKSVRFMLRLLKNAESNADAKNLDLEDLYIRNITVQQAPVCTFSAS
jgi:large subunit ribosomal protein L17e